MSILRWSPVLLALATVAAVGQQPANPAPTASGIDAQSDVEKVPDKVMHIGGKIQKPAVIYMPMAQFSEQARAAHFSGQVLIYLLVDKNGKPQHIRVVKGVGMGLDQNAVEAVRKYKFKPATLNGEPVTVDLYVNVNFQIVDAPM
jgi:TonB family protein